MAILSPSFVLGLVVLFYLLSFVLFAIIRISTGISIQRIGYLSLRRIAYTPRDGVRIDLRALGLHLHRPTFAQPTWISLRLSELKVTVDIKAMAAKKRPTPGEKVEVDEESDTSPDDATDLNPSKSRQSTSGQQRSRTWKQLTDIKERIKKLHEQIRWIRMVDVEVLNSTLVVVDVCSVQVGTLTMAVDTRLRTVDRGRLFRHKKIPAGEQQPAEWMFVVKGVLFTPEGRDSLEILDMGSLNVHGLLYKNLAGLRDASISLKLGRIHVPYDDLVRCRVKADRLQTQGSKRRRNHEKQVSFSDMMEEFEKPGSREEQIVQTVSDSKEFIASILRGIQEIQLAVSFIGLSKEIAAIHTVDRVVYLNFAMNEFGIDLYRLDPKSPAHRMYFPPQDIAHQALLAAISIAVSIDDDSGKPERIMYVPMATTTIKTTLPSKTISSSGDRNAAERNANMLFANLVVTSPSIDLDLKHMPIVISLLQKRRAQRQIRDETMPNNRHTLISKLLPKASVKVSVQEPVLRVVIPTADKAIRSSDNYDLLISVISSISLDLDSSHSSAGELHYALTSNLRVTSHEFYYQAAGGERHNIILMDALDLKVQLTATPEVSVVVAGNLQTFSIHMMRPEIAKGVHLVMQQLSKQSPPKEVPEKIASRPPSFLRQLPFWLVHASFQGSNFGIEVAGVDAGVSKDTRGVALQLESWNAEYKIQKSTTVTRRHHRHHGVNASLSGDEGFVVKAAPSAPLKPGRTPSTDGRRLAIHVQGFEGFIVEGVESWEPESFLSVPRFEVAMSTGCDSYGQTFHINSHVKALYVQYSLYRYYAIGVAHKVLTRALSSRSAKLGAQVVQPEKPIIQSAPTELSASAEAITADFKAGLVQVKGTMPTDPRMMLQVYGIEAGHHRYTVPFVRARVIRLYVEPPRIKSAWARIVSIKNARIDMRTSTKVHGTQTVTERSIDVTSDYTRLAVPHQVVLHTVFDNIVNTVKATEQLHHRFATGTDEYVLKKGPEGPRNVPRVSFRCRALSFELEDGSFDWKIGIIYRVGLNEQKQRIAREEAFRVKVKRMADRNTRRNSAPRLASTGRGRTKSSNAATARERSRSEGSPGTQTTASHSTHRGRNMRYDTDATCGLTGSAKISADEAYRKLQEHNAASWRKRINFAMRYQNHAMKDIRNMFWGSDELPENVEEKESIISLPGRPGLMTTLISDLHIIIDKPSFPMKGLPDYMHTVGKGMPYDTKYSLLIPMSVQINMGEARVTLRNYPLPLLHVPAIKPNQSSRLPSWSLKTDFVIAEEFRDEESTKHVRVQIIPPEKLHEPKEVSKGFVVDVRRTVSPVKTYSNVDIAINTSNPTVITWGTSYQPAIQDMMQVIESFTKPQIDPSERVGFWDKIRMGFHSRVRVAWKGDGDVHLKLKGSRDPYIVTGHGAGFVMCFRNNVKWDLHQDDDPKKFMTVSCGEYVLAIPDYSSQARQSSAAQGQDSESVSSRGSTLSNAMFKKVVMKLSGNVRWMAGIVFERDLESNGRSFEFTPHYDITLKVPHHAKEIDGKTYDAFRGFRSHHIHLSIAVIAPVDRDWSVTNLKASSSYNSIHLTPKFFTHFFDWWSLFSGVMALPVRQGALFPGVEKSSKKFGRHLATIKYNLLLSPLFIAHIYKHKDVEDYSEKVVGATGLKLRINSFMLDLHQRREEFHTQSRGRLKQAKTTAMKINRAQLDFISADMRAVSASIAGTSKEDLQRASDAELAFLGDQAAVSPDISRFLIPDNDFTWIDMDDFVELDWILPAEEHPETKIMPLAFAPRFTYFRRTDHETDTQGDEATTSPFGDEPTHFCLMTQDADPQHIQSSLVKERVGIISKQLDQHKRYQGDLELRVIREGSLDPSLQRQLDEHKQQGDVLERKKVFMQSMADRLTSRLDKVSTNESASSRSASSYPGNETPSSLRSAKEEPGLIEAEDFESDFNNRFAVHNIQLKWNNSLRNVILRYVHQVSQRRGFVYYMSRRAVKFILDIVEEQKRTKERRRPSQHGSTTTQPSPSPSTSFRSEADELELEERIQELLRDGNQFVNANDPEPANKSPVNPSPEANNDISEEFTALNSYHVQLIAPQIQLQSEKNPKSVLLVTGKGMELKVIQIMDKSRLADDVSGLVQRRFSVDMDGVQFFVTNQKALAKVIHLYSANRYGCPKGTTWPPWAPLEVNFDFNLDPFGWYRVVQKTSASLRYDKYNTLRLKYNDEVTKADAGQANTSDDAESRMDHLWVEFPHIRAICDSTQYYAMYVIVLDLLLYSEPLEKIRSERLEKIMLAADFSDLTGAPEMVISLQERIQQLAEIKGHFQLQANYLDRQGWQDRLQIEKDIASCEDELFFMMKAITTSQRKNTEQKDGSQSNGLLRWYLSASEIVWHLMREKNEAMVEFQLKHAAYHRTDNSDGSNKNIMEIERIRGLNLLPDTIYPEMIAPYFENGQTFAAFNEHDVKMFKVQWHMLEAIAGIPVLDNFEVNLFPLKIQLEREVGKQLFEYIFPDHEKNTASATGAIKQQTAASPSDDEDELALSVPSTPQSASFVDLESSTPSTRAGSIELRLKPTLNLPEAPRPHTSHGAKLHPPSSTAGSMESHRFKLFHSNRSQSASRSQVSLQPAGPSKRSLSSKRSRESLRMTAISRDQSSTELSTMAGSERNPRRFGLQKSQKDSSEDSEKANDDLTQMLSRASNYMTLAYVKVPSVVLCLSYKGKGERNIEDVHDFVFRMPALEYRNKTWSNLDLALRLKKDVIKALISHTGAIIGNKFSHHRPNKAQQSRLREIANSSSLLPNADSITSVFSRKSAGASTTNSSVTNLTGTSSSGRPATANFIAGWGSTVIDPVPLERSSFDSMISPRNHNGEHHPITPASTAFSPRSGDSGLQDDQMSPTNTGTGSQNATSDKMDKATGANGLGSPSALAMAALQMDGSLPRNPNLTPRRSATGAVNGHNSVSSTNDGVKEAETEESESRKAKVFSLGKKILHTLKD